MGESPSSIPYTLAAIVFTDIVGFSRLMAENLTHPEKKR